jgi:DNA-binding IclR family transcriptional regulator
MKARLATAERPEADGDLVTWQAGTQLLARAVSLILYLRERDDEATVGELASALKVPVNTAYRLVRTLELGGLVDRSHRPYVSLGLRLMDLGLAKQRQVTRELAPVAQPVLEALTAETGETSLLLMPTGARAICIFAIEPSRAIRLSYQPGRVLPLYAGASGKVMLPWVSAQLVQTALAQGEGQLLAGGRRITAASLKAELKSIRACGYCVTHDELDLGASAIAAPVFTRGGQIFASVSIAGPTGTFTEERLPTLIERVVAAAGEIGRGLAQSWTAAAAQARS